MQPNFLMVVDNLQVFYNYTNKRHFYDFCKYDHNLNFFHVVFNFSIN